MLIIDTMKTLITFPHAHIGAFNRSYKAKIAKKEAILKIYDNKRAASFSRKFDKNHHKIVKKASETKITPNLLYLNESLIIHEYLKNTPINRKNFLKSNILSLFKKTLENFHAIKIEKTLSLYAQIINYQSVLKNKGLFKQVIDNAENIKKYINKYKQNYLCHGDLHFENIIHHKRKIYFIDLDYVCVSAKGYDIAMLVYQEKISKKEIKEISKKLQINHYEILHYIPICYLLDYLWQEIQIEFKYIKKNNVEEKVIKNFLKNIS